MLEVRFYLTGADYWAFNTWYTLKKRLLRRRSRLALSLLVAIGFVLGLIVLPDAVFATLLVSVIAIFLLSLVLLLLLLVLRWASRTKINRWLARLGEHLVTISEEGFYQKNLLTEALIFWHAFTDITSDKHNLYFLVDLNITVVHIIPRRAFGSPQDAEAFLSQARAYWTSALANPPAPAGTPPSYERWG